MSHLFAFFGSVTEICGKQPYDQIAIPPTWLKSELIIGKAAFHPMDLAIVRDDHWVTRRLWVHPSSGGPLFGRILLSMVQFDRSEQTS